MTRTYLEGQLKYCGKILNSLIEKILSLNIPEKHILSCCCLPTIVGYNSETNLYFAKIQEERSNNLKVIFESDSEKDFTFYILELFARSWGQKFELDNRETFQSLWRFLRDKVIEGKWQYKEISNFKFNAIYDSRKVFFETTINCLLNVYSADEISDYIKNLTGFLNNNREIPYIIWTYSVKDKEFIVKENII